MLPLLIAGLMGCDALNKAKDTLDGLLEPLVVQSIVLGIEPPQNEDLRELLDRSEFRAGTTVTVFMADARDVQEIENAPVTGANVRVMGPGVDAVVPEVDGGTYLLSPAQELVEYDAGATWELRAVRTRGDQTATSTASLSLPADADFTAEIPTDHDVGQPISLDFSGLGFDGALVVVIDDAGAVTYSNEPKTIRELYDFTRGSAQIGVVTIPAEAFPDEGVFLVGVAGTTHTRAADLSGMNTALTTVVMGKMRMYGVSTIDVPLP